MLGVKEVTSKGVCISCNNHYIKTAQQFHPLLLFSSALVYKEIANYKYLTNELCDSCIDERNRTSYTLEEQ